MQERILIYIAAIGPKNTQLTGEIADGWLPLFFSPEHVDESRRVLEEGAALGALARRLFDIVPGVNVCIDDDGRRARPDAPLHRPLRGRHGPRKRNFYNSLVERYGFADAAREVQDLYLDGKKDEAAAAVPAELIDTITPRRPARQGPRADGGVSRRRRGHADREPDRAFEPAASRRMVRDLAELL